MLNKAEEVQNYFGIHEVVSGEFSQNRADKKYAVSYTHLRAHET